MTTQQTMTPTAHEKSEWSRLASNAYAKGLNTYGHRYSVAASLGDGVAMPIGEFDSLQSLYRAWLNWGFRNDSATR